MKRQNPSQLARRKPLFGRRFLWLTILLLLLLIPLLDRLGPSEAFMVSPPAEGDVQTQFDLADLSPQVSAPQGIPVIWVHLPDSNHISLTVVDSRQPGAAPEQPEAVDFELSSRHGRLLITAHFPLTSGALEDGTRFLNLWLPTPTDTTRYVISGNLTEERMETISERLSGSDAPGSPFSPARRSSVTSVTAPYPDSDDYLAFRIAMDLLEQQLGGYNARLSWDEGARQSRALFNISLDPQQRQLPNAERFEAARERWAMRWRSEGRSARYIHDQLITAAAYDQNPETVLDWGARVRALDYDQFADVWEEWVGGTQ